MFNENQIKLYIALGAGRMCCLQLLGSVPRLSVCTIFVLG